MNEKEAFATEEFPLDQIKQHLARREAVPAKSAGGKAGAGTLQGKAAGPAMDPLEAAAAKAKAAAASAIAKDPELAAKTMEEGGAFGVAGPVKPEFFDLPPLERVKKKEAKRGPEAWKVLLAVLICMLFAMGSYFVGQVYGATLIPEDEPLFINPDDGFISPVEDSETLGGATGTQVPKILTVLLMGVDQRYENELARADVTILASLNLDTKEVDLISIPRDTRAEIAGTNLTRKINYAHATGGPERMVETVENLLGINVHYYVEVNFEGFAECIDILGGVDYNVERRMYLPDEGIDLMPGQQKLTGDKALQYVRWRGDPTADIGRIGRQQQFLEALMKQAFSVSTVTKLPSLINSLMENIKTDMTAAQMVVLAAEFSDMNQVSLETMMLPGEAKTISGASYWVLDEAAVQQMIQEVFAAPALDNSGLTGTEADTEDTAAETAGAV